ncbi:MAG: hypothetical protein IKG89_00770, partial [Oscillospiraceae bacterium]|nr:hypothetical protein [Oscillospiraceae bacterium]
MKKRLFALLLTLVLVFSVLPATTFAAEAAPGERYGGGLVSETRAKLTRLGSLTQTETFDISAATRKAVGNLIVAGLKNRAGEIDVSAYGLTPQEVASLYYEVLDAHYELFYVRSSAYYSSSWIQPLYDTTYSQSDVAAFNALCASIVAGVPQGTNAEKLLYLHDYLVTHCEYDLTYSKTNAYNALVEGRAVCDGYSKAYKVLCDLAGLTCEFVSSQANNHSWNMVQVKDGGDTAWYYIDCTWDDPTNTAKGLTAESCCMHENFLLSKAECAVKHESGDWVNGRGESVYGYTTGTKYQNFWWRELIRPVQWVGTQMCYAKPDEVDQVFLRSSGAASETGAEIPGGGALWYVWDNPGSYYVPLSYITVASDGGSFYCSTPTRIWKLTPGGEMTLFYTLSSAEQAKGYLYGIRRGADGLIYYIGQDPMQSSVASGILNIPASAASTVPVLVSAKATAGQITVKWSAVTSAAKYAVYRKAAGESSWTRLTNTVTGTSYTDKSMDLKAGITYYYTVRAYVGGTWGGYDAAGVS